MAKRLYEEERIGAIATKIRELVPTWYNGTFTTADMPAALERIYDEGKSKGNREGYSYGYIAGFFQGKEDGQLSGYNKGYNEGLVGGAESVKRGEARTDDDIIIDGDSFTVPSGYYAETAEKHINVDPFYDAGYKDGYKAGVESVGTYEDGNEVAY